MKPDGKPLANKPPSPAIWVRTYKSASGKEGRVFASTQGASEDIVSEGVRRVIINGVFWCMGLEKEIKADMVVKNRDAWICSHDCMTRYPFQANTYGLPKNIIKDCLLGFIENKFTDRNKITNYKEWIHYMFGKGFAEHFLLPYSKKFWGIDAENLTTDWVNVRHPKPSLNEVITGALEDQTKGFGINAVFRYPKKGGFGYIADRIANQCNDRIYTDMEALDINVNKKEIKFNNGTIVSYENLLSTIPLPELINIIPEAPSEIKNAVSFLQNYEDRNFNIGTAILKDLLCQ